MTPTEYDRIAQECSLRSAAIRKGPTKLKSCGKVLLSAANYCASPMAHLDLLEDIS